MENTYWHKQVASKPLFPDLLWSRPENKSTAGKLLIIGGNLHGFAAPAEAYAEAIKAGIGTARVLLPDATKKLIGPLMENGEFAPSTPSGSFSRLALADFFEHAAWSDGVLIAGELGRNSETAIVLEQFITKHSGPITITRDSIDYFKDIPEILVTREHTTLVLSLAQLQKIFMNTRSPSAITLGMHLLKLVEALHEFTLGYPANIMVKHHDQIVVASHGQVSTTKLEIDLPIWRVKTAAQANVWWLQNSTKPFEALSSAVFSGNSRI